MELKLNNLLTTIYGSHTLTCIDSHMIIYVKKFLSFNYPCEITWGPMGNHVMCKL